MIVRHRSALALVAVALMSCRGRRAAPSTKDADAGVRDAAVVPGRALTAADLDRLAALAIAPYSVVVADRTDHDLALVVVDGPRRISLTASSCLGCIAPTVAAWEAQRPSLAALWAPGTESAPPLPGARLALAAVDVGTQRAITIDARRGDGAPTAFVGHWNDGVTQVQAVCEDGPIEGAGAPPCAAPVIAALTAAIAALR